MVILFREEQRFRQLWIWLLIGGIATLQWWGFIQQIIFGQPWGDNPAPDWMMWLLWLAIGIGMPAFFAYLRLIVTVTPQAVEIHFRPLSRRSIAITEIAAAEAGEYSPLRQYGGWGIRGLGNNRAYSISGKQGVLLTLTDGRKVLIGSLRPNQLADAIAASR